MARERKFSDKTLYNAAKHILLNNGYEGFTFSLLADKLKVSRGALYKYYENKEELIMDYMIFEMNRFLAELKEIDNYDRFDSQFDFLIRLMFKHNKIHQVLGFSYQITATISKNIKVKKVHLEKLHLEMYSVLQSFIQQGRKEQLLNPSIKDELLLGFIFQSVDIPNHSEIPQTEWVRSVKELISHGMFTDK
ncbi:transcriptional regulator, TetR family [Virgibacillus subterraneus]|uniref:Transcriptional regulator, TetR family n=2 Tax=Virgibacillus TaxID=84406 RepID=A0A1H1FMS4_9BACI|nr:MULTISPECIES: TetR/AcrR family transcriptional regulator [Virgibacillus]SDR02068.1 transcriptional regulator, TetR family [Virgibacillus salinus]SEQ72232.1 transcriptional regulator, TetR family [Virgibacillus subterraneus]